MNFTWFALLRHKKFDDKPLFIAGELFDFLPFWIWDIKMNIIFCYEQQYNDYIRRKKILNKNCFDFLKKFSLFIEWPSFIHFCAISYVLGTCVYYHRYSYQIQIIYIHNTIANTTTPGQSVPRSNGHKGVLHASQNSSTGTSQPDAVKCPFWQGG